MYRLKMFLFFIMLILVFDKTNAFMKDVPLVGKVIYLDAGHPSLDKPNVIVMSCSK